MRRKDKFVGIILLAGFFPAIASASCINGTARYLPCAVGFAGERIQKCNASGSWVDVTYSCTAITCDPGGLIHVGDSVNDTTDGCPASFTNGTGNANYRETCILPLTNTLTGGSGTYSAPGTYVVTSTNCKPTYAACGSGTQTLPSCPMDTTAPNASYKTTGQVVQTCVQSNWQTTTNSCAQAALCDGQPVGSYRVMQGRSCPPGQVGSMLEVCYPNGQWLVSTVNCAAIQCLDDYYGEPFTGNPSGIWGPTNAGSSATNTLQDGNSCTRNCSLTGQWQAVNNGTSNCN